MVLGQHERGATLLGAGAIALQNGLHRRPRLEVQPVLLDREERARGESDQVARVRQRPGLVIVVHAPHQPALEVAPRAEVLHVEITHREDLRSIQQSGTDHRPALRPAEERSSEEGEGCLRHRRVLAPQVGGNEPQPLSQPALVSGVDLGEPGDPALLVRHGLSPPSSAYRAQAPGGRYPTCFFVAASTTSGAMSRVERSVAAPLELTARLSASALASSGNSVMPTTSESPKE